MFYAVVVCLTKVCKDIDECDIRTNGGCVENSICLNTPVSMDPVKSRSKSKICVGLIQNMLLA